MCLPTRPFGEIGGKGGESRCLVIVGEAPGATEDAQGQSWCGSAGGLLRRLYIHDVFGFDGRLDVFLSNVVRCRPPQNAVPSKKQMKACLPYLWDDLRVLEQQYSEVIVLCCGATAAKAFGFSSLKEAFSHQSHSFTVPEPEVVKAERKLQEEVDAVYDEVMASTTDDDVDELVDLAFRLEQVKQKIKARPA